MTGPSAAVASKADRYLVEGRLAVVDATPDGVHAEVAGTADKPYSTSWTVWSGWACTCPARIRRCCHVLALQTVVDIGRLTSPPDVHEGVCMPPRPPPARS